MSPPAKCHSWVFPAKSLFSILARKLISRHDCSCLRCESCLYFLGHACVRSPRQRKSRRRRDCERTSENVCLGRRMTAWLPGEPGYADSLATPDAAIDPATWRAVCLAREEDGVTLTVGLLRPLGWLAERPTPAAPAPVVQASSQLQPAAQPRRAVLEETPPSGDTQPTVRHAGRLEKLAPRQPLLLPDRPTQGQKHRPRTSQAEDRQMRQPQRVHVFETSPPTDGGG